MKIKTRFRKMVLNCYQYFFCILINRILPSFNYLKIRVSNWQKIVLNASKTNQNKLNVAFKTQLKVNIIKNAKLNMFAIHWNCCTWEIFSNIWGRNWKLGMFMFYRRSIPRLFFLLNVYFFCEFFFVIFRCFFNFGVLCW